MEQIFRVGDTVYHWSYGKGKVVVTNYSPEFPIGVEFEGEGMEGITFSFTSDGRCTSNELPSLSHTPYDLINGGFSQRKPLPNIKKGTPVFVKLYPSYSWTIRVFSHFDGNEDIWAFNDAKLTGDTTKWDEYSLENPFKYNED